MSRQHKLAPVITAAKQTAETALLTLGKSNAELSLAQQQLDELQRYRDEYLLRFRQTDPMVMTAKKALDLRSFLAQLDQTIRVQEEQVEQQRRQVAYHQRLWLEARKKEQALELLHSKYELAEQQLQQKQEQRASDEYTHSNWVRRRQNR